MSKKVYRCFVDVKASSLENARKGINALTDGNGSQFRIQENPFDDEEEGTILEIANKALLDSKFYLYLADQLDLSDKELNKLLRKIEGVTNR